MVETDLIFNDLRKAARPGILVRIGDNCALARRPWTSASSCRSATGAWGLNSALRASGTLSAWLHAADGIAASRGLERYIVLNRLNAIYFCIYLFIWLNPRCCTFDREENCDLTLFSTFFFYPDSSTALWSQVNAKLMRKHAHHITDAQFAWRPTLYCFRRCSPDYKELVVTRGWNTIQTSRQRQNQGLCRIRVSETNYMCAIALRLISWRVKLC